MVSWKEKPIISNMSAVLDWLLEHAVRCKQRQACSEIAVKTEVAGTTGTVQTVHQVTDKRFANSAKLHFPYSVNSRAAGTQPGGKLCNDSMNITVD